MNKSISLFFVVSLIWLLFISGKGPWEMVLIIHGFPNEISALRFEWAWQNPEKSLRLKHLVPKTKQFNFIFKFNVVCEMLRIGPWCRLPLSIRWLKQEYERAFPINKMPPSHMPIVYGPVVIKDRTKSANKLQKRNSQSPVKPVHETNSRANCFICRQEMDANRLKCIKCHVETHRICLAKYFLHSTESDLLIPVEGPCPKCNQVLLWGDLIRFKLGCYKDLDVSFEDIDNDNDVIDTDDGTESE